MKAVSAIESMDQTRQRFCLFLIRYFEAGLTQRHAAFSSRTDPSYDCRKLKHRAALESFRGFILTKSTEYLGSFNIGYDEGRFCTFIAPTNSSSAEGFDAIFVMACSKEENAIACCLPNEVGQPQPVRDLHKAGLPSANYGPNGDVPKRWFGSKGGLDLFGLWLTFPWAD